MYKKLKKIFKFLFAVVVISIGFVSCVSKRNVLYFQDVERLNQGIETNNYQTIIRPDDLLTITVSALNPETVIPFNPPLVSSPTVDGTIRNTQQIQTYLVDKSGEIEFPVVGTIELGGLTRQEAINELHNILSEYIINPIINLRILNYTITVMGEVNNPGTFTVNDERITVLEALGYAGDMTIFGKRKDVIVVREENGDKSYGKLDFTSADVMNSPYYYLQQNDVVIVSPNTAQVQSSGFNRNSSIFVSIAGIVISVIAILTR
tara:strand:- start:97444 stop:98232 length:789 start_codon:yes stop_codon:yes gene_type:complete